MQDSYYRDNLITFTLIHPVNMRFKIKFIPLHPVFTIMYLYLNKHEYSILH